jgi:ABC-type glycerol-3-phosphate transport system substrate-binding protein
VVPAKAASFRLSLATVLAIVAVVVLPAGAMAMASGSFDDPIGDSSHAVDLGATTVTVGDDDTITVDTRLVSRPDATANVTWYFDYFGGRGPDAKVAVVSSSDRILWKSAHRDAPRERFSSGTPPTGAEGPDDLVWTSRLSDLGIPTPATLRVWAVSRHRAYNDLGVLVTYSDTASPATLSLPPSSGPRSN